jgi:hypothetical protein
MSVTATNRKPTLQTTLNGVEGPGRLSNVFSQAKLGTMLRSLKVTATGLTAAASFDLTALLAAGLAQGVPATFAIVGDLPEGYVASSTPLPPANVVKSLRVTASGTGVSVGNYVAGDAGSTKIVPPGGAGVAVGVATLSDDGKTITFPNTVTAFVIHYMPAATVDMGTVLPSAP